jgi:hypothetical protein
MNKQKTGFWRGFTWRRFTVKSLISFTALMLIEFFGSLVDHPHNIFNSFTLRFFIKMILQSIFLGFLLSLWFEPGVDDRKTEKIPQA